MSLTFPRPLHLPKLAECTITLDAGTALASHHGGLRSTVSRIRERVWAGRFETPRLSHEDRIGWQAWAHSLDGGLQRFVAWDTARFLPLAYRGAGQMPNGWNGNASVTDLSAPSQIVLSGVPAGYQAKAGDRIGLEQTISTRAHYGYYEIMADAVAAGGGALTVHIQPFVQPVFTAGAVAKLLQPLCLFQLTEFSAPQSVDFPPATFSAVQTLGMP